MRTRWVLGAVGLMGTMACDTDGISVSSSDEAVTGRPDRWCQDFNVPVEPLLGTQVYLQYCTPPESQSNGTVIFMVHTSFHNHLGWDPPRAEFSQVTAALKAGFTVVNIDRLGTGQSTLPPSQLVTIERVNQAIHQVVIKLRNGSLTGKAHSSIVWLGSSFGASYSWQHAGLYPHDFDGFVLNGVQHRSKVSWAEFALGGEAIISVCDDPVFSQRISDCGYLIDAIGFKGPLYYDEPNAAPGMLSGPDWEVNVLRDVASQYLVAASAPFLGILVYPDPTKPGGLGVQAIPVDPLTSPSQNLRKPTLLVVGENDPIFCGGPEGYVCDEPTILAFEAPYYANAPVFDVFVPLDTGHPINLHLNAASSMDVQHEWVLDNIVNQ